MLTLLLSKYCALVDGRNVKQAIKHTASRIRKRTDNAKTLAICTKIHNARNPVDVVNEVETGYIVAGLLPPPSARAA